MAPTNAADSSTEMLRPLADFPKSIWEGRFKPIIVDEQVYKLQVKEIEGMKETVGNMLIKIKQGKSTEKLIFIDTIERLGISYHFEKEIESLVDQIFHENVDSEDLQNDLFFAALKFRLLRQHGFDISSGIFNPFLNSNGNFRESLREDKKGLLSLYEAAHLKTQKDSILEEALHFSTIHLKRDQHKIMSSLLVKQVNHALVQALHKGFHRIEARHYISIYEEDETRNPLLLRFAKLDFNHLQILYRKELDHLFSWSEGLECRSLVPYSRPRLVECYMWGLTSLFEPKYSLNRIALGKTYHLATVLDDTYDAHGTLDELILFRDALERWDVKEISTLPKYMKAIYNDLMNLYKWSDDEFTKQGISRPFALTAFQEEWKRYVRGNYTQSVWLLKRQFPGFEDYREIALYTSSFFLATSAAFLFMDIATEDVCNWLLADPDILVASAEVGRFLNDVASHKSEKERSASGLECYMKNYEVSEEEAMTKLEEIVDDAWKKMNEEVLKPTMIREILISVVNLARMTDVCYKDRQDGYTDPVHNLEPHIVAVLLHIIHV